VSTALKSTVRRIPELDGLRGIAVVLVLILHLQELIAYPDTLLWKLIQRILAGGWIGVDMFFVLSGYLITDILLQKKQPFKVFYANRFARIMPLFFLVFGAVLAIYPKQPVLVVVLYSLFLGNFTIMTGTEIRPLGHFWSLAVEEQFYLFWPQIARRCSARVILKVALSAMILVSILRTFGMLVHVNSYVLYKITPTRLDGILCGSGLAAALSLPAGRQLIAKWQRFLLIVPAVMLLLTFIMLKCSLFAWDSRTQVLAIPAVSILTAALIAVSVLDIAPTSWKWCASSPFLQYFGKRSYAIYLYHEVLRYYCDQWRSVILSMMHQSQGILSGVQLALMVVALSVVLAELSFYLIERPSQKIKLKLIAKFGQ